MEDYDAGGEIRLTIIRDRSLSSRLSSEVALVFSRAKTTWPDFKNDPIGFARKLSGELWASLESALRQPYVILSSLTAVLIVVSLALSVLMLGPHKSARVRIGGEDLASLVALDLSAVETDPDSGVGVNGPGRVGINQGQGEGSLSTPSRAGGGGGGGNHSTMPAQQGRLPVPSDIPAPVPINRVTLPPTLPEAGIDIDPALWRNLPYASYGDPRSKSIATSAGPGDAGGIGSGQGTGIGEGGGPGFGPGTDGNTGGGPKNIGGLGSGSGGGRAASDVDRIFRMPEVSEKAHLLSKPEPQYTEEARRNQITGTVVLRVVFSKSGEVTNIRAVQSLPSGLTERAIAAARQIRFLPARKSGQPVSVFMQLEYNFNLY